MPQNVPVSDYDDNNCASSNGIIVAGIIMATCWWIISWTAIISDGE